MNTTPPPSDNPQPHRQQRLSQAEQLRLTLQSTHEPAEQLQAVELYLPYFTDPETLCEAQFQAARLELQLGRTLGALQRIRSLPTVTLSLQHRVLQAELTAQALSIQGEFDTAISYLQNACDWLAQQPGSEAEHASMLIKLAQAKHHIDQSNEALEDLRLAQEIRNEQRDISGAVRACNNRALILIQIGQPQTALPLLQWSLDMLQHTQDSSTHELLIQNNLGMLLESLRQYPEAKEHFMRGRQIARQLTPEPDERYYALTLNAGEMARLSGQLEEAEHLLSEVHAHLQPLTSTNGLPSALEIYAIHNLGLTHLAQGKRSAAYEELQLAEQLAQRSGELQVRIDCLLGLASYHSQGSHNDHAQARALAEQTLQLATANTRPQATLQAHYLLADICEHTEPAMTITHLKEIARLERLMRDQDLMAHRMDIKLLDTEQEIRRRKEREHQLDAIKHQLHADAEHKLRCQIERLKREQFYDQLTGLPTRPLQDALVEQLLRSETPLSLLLIELPQLKALYEAQGQANAEGLLRAVARRLQQVISSGETLTRSSHDEFSVLISASPQQALLRASQIIQVFSRDFTADDAPELSYPLSLSIKAGIAHAPDHGERPDELHRAACAALERLLPTQPVAVYQGQASTRARAVKLETALAHALENGEFHLYYQPLVNAKTRAVTGAETLLRWRNPLHGNPTPDRFIPSLERTGLIVPVGHWILQQACQQATQWPEHMRVAVNLSPLQLTQPDFVERINDALNQSGLAPERLELEITEQVMVHSPAQAVQLFHQLKATGVRIILDDFGTGYSNMSYLHTFPLDGLKIDRSFLQSLYSSPASRAILRTILELGHTPKLEVTGEGIEDEAQHHFLRDLGVDTLQGYFFGKPVPELSAEHLTC